MNKNQRQIFAGILIFLIFILLGILTQITDGFLGFIVGILGLIFFFGGAYLINLFVVEEPERIEKEVRKEYEKKR